MTRPLMRLMGEETALHSANECVDDDVSIMAMRKARSAVAVMREWPRCGSCGEPGAWLTRWYWDEGRGTQDSKTQSEVYLVCPEGRRQWVSSGRCLSTVRCG